MLHLQFFIFNFKSLKEVASLHSTGRLAWRRMFYKKFLNQLNWILFEILFFIIFVFTKNKTAGACPLMISKILRINTCKIFSSMIGLLFSHSLPTIPDCSKGSIMNYIDQVVWVLFLLLQWLLKKAIQNVNKQIERFHGQNFVEHPSEFSQEAKTLIS